MTAVDGALAPPYAIKKRRSKRRFFVLAVQVSSGWILK